MRILGVSQKWPKLKSDLWTTFRFPRKDTDWAVGEVVQVVYKPRSKERDVVGIARIIRKESKDLNKRWQSPNTPDMITPSEAAEDGFPGMHNCGDTEKMRRFFIDTYGYSRSSKELINKLTLYWIKIGG